MSQKIFFPILTLTLALLSSGKAEAAEVTVSNAPGLQAALSAAESNGEPDIINLLAGTYSGTTFTYSAQENFSLTLIGPADRSAIIDGENARAPMDLFTNALANDTQADIAVRNLSVVNGLRDNSGGGGIYIGVDNAPVSVENCLFENNLTDHDSSFNSGGLMLRAQGDGPITIRNNSFIDNTAAQGSGGGARIFRTSASVTGAEILVDSNIFIGNTALNLGGGLDLANSGGDQRRSVVRNNLFFDNTLTANTLPLAGGGAFNAFGNGSEDSYVNNTAVGNTTGPDGCGVSMSGGTPSISNNVFRDNLAGGANVDICPLGSLDYEGFFNNDIGVALGCDPSLCGPGQRGNLSVDPMFVDLGLEDFRLALGSPAINQGDGNAPDLPETDLAGNPRIVGPAPDMGAYEAQASLVVTPTQHDFGSVDVGDASSVEILLQNQGPLPVTVSDLILSDPVNFSLDVNGGSQPCGNVTPVIGADGSCSVLVSYHPESSGADSATLSIQSNDPAQPEILVTLNGSGTSLNPVISGGGCSLQTTMSPAGPTGIALAMAFLLGLRLKRR